MGITSSKTFDRGAFERSAFWTTTSRGEAAVNIEGSVQLYNAAGEIIETFGGGGAGGGGNNTWSNAQGDFTATTTDATTNITLAGLPFTLNWKHVALGSISKKTSAGVVSTLDKDNISVSGNVITISDEDDFASGDEVFVSLFGPDKAYDGALDSGLQTVLNPEYSHYTSVEKLVTESDLGIDGTHDGGDNVADFEDSGETYTAASVAEGFVIHNVTDVSSASIDVGGAGNPGAGDIGNAALAGGTDDDWDDNDVASIPECKRFVIPAEGYNHLAIHAKITAGAANTVYMLVYATLNSDADNTADDDWVDVSSDVLGAANITAAASSTTEGIYFINTPTVVLKYMIKIVAECSDGVQENDFDVYIKKSS